MNTIVYDTGALLAAERGDGAFLKLHRAFVRADERPIVPVVVLAQAWRGRPQPGLSRLLKGCDVLPDDEKTGRAAGLACASAGTSDVVDAIVMATAVKHQATVITSDPGDLHHLAESVGVKVRVITV